MTESVITAQVIRDFIASYDASEPADRLIAARLRDSLRREIYRREREMYSQWVDVGGEG